MERRSTDFHCETETPTAPFRAPFVSREIPPNGVPGPHLCRNDLSAERPTQHKCRPGQRQEPATGPASETSDQRQQQHPEQQPKPPGTRGIPRPNGVPGPHLCRNDLSAERPTQHKCRPGSLGERDEVCCSGYEAGRRRVIGVVAALPDSPARLRRWRDAGSLGRQSVTAAQKAGAENKVRNNSSDGERGRIRSAGDRTNPHRYTTKAGRTPALRTSQRPLSHCGNEGRSLYMVLSAPAFWCGGSLERPIAPASPDQRGRAMGAGEGCDHADRAPAAYLEAGRTDLERAPRGSPVGHCAERAE